MNNVGRFPALISFCLFSLAMLASCSLLPSDDYEEDDDYDYALNNPYQPYIVFDANGGTGAMPIQNIDRGETVLLQANTFTRPDHVFAGWATGKTTRVVYRDQDQFALEDNAYSGYLYAIWRYSAISAKSLSAESRTMVSMKSINKLDGSGFLLAHDGSAYKQAVSVSEGFNNRISPFAIGAYEVTYQLWYVVRTWAQANGYSFSHFGKEGASGYDDKAPTESGKLLPVTDISWEDALVWCNAYSEMTGKTPVYYTDYSYASPLRSVSDIWSHSRPDRNANADGYRLPTEGEWQYAASCAGTYPCNYASGAATYFYSVNDANGNGIADGQEANDAVSVYRDDSNTQNGMSPVGTRVPNAFGLYDMSGNAFEWCVDFYEAALPAQYDEVNDYAGPTTGDVCVIRGGSFLTDAASLQIGVRDKATRNNGRNDCGFRIAASE